MELRIHVVTQHHWMNGSRRSSQCCRSSSLAINLTLMEEALWLMHHTQACSRLGSTASLNRHLLAQDVEGV